MLKKILCFGFLLSLSSFAQISLEDIILEDNLYDGTQGESISKKNDFDTDTDGFPLIEFQVVDQVQNIEQQNLEEYIREATPSRYKHVDAQAYTVQLKDILDSGTYLGIVRRKTKVVRIQDEKVFYIPIDTRVRAFRKKDYEGYQLLLNNNGKVKYKILAHDISNIKNILNMHEKPLFYSEVKRKAQPDKDDNQLNLKTQLNFSLGLTSPVFIKELVYSDSHYGQQLKYEAQIYGNWDFPIHVGISGNYEKNFGTTSVNKYDMSSINLGPIFKTKNNDWGLRAYTQVQIAIHSSIAITSSLENIEYTLSQTSLNLGFEKDLQLKSGNQFIWGLSYQRQWIQPKANEVSLNVETGKNYNDSYAIFFGHGMDWQW